MAVALSIFAFIFLSSLPGRTTFIIVMLTANGKSGRVFTGAALAFLIQSLISVIAGEALELVPSIYIEMGAGLLFLYFSGKFWLEAKNPVETKTSERSPREQTIKSVFTLIFTAEIGDVSQLAIATSASRTSSKALVFGVAVAALWSITAIAILLGGRIARILRPPLLQTCASFSFFALGVYLCGKAIYELLQ